MLRSSPLDKWLDPRTRNAKGFVALPARTLTNVLQAAYTCQKIYAAPRYKYFECYTGQEFAPASRQFCPGSLMTRPSLCVPTAILLWAPRKG